MSSGSIVRRLIGAVKNGVVWSATWFVLAVATMLVLRTIGVMVPPEIGVIDMIGMGIRIGIVGGLAGGAFSAFIALAYRGRRLSQINALRFGVGGAIVAELFLLAFFAVGGLVSGDGFPALGNIGSDLIIAAVFGGVTAGASMWLAQRGGPGASDDWDAPSRVTGDDRVASVGAGDPGVSAGAGEARQRVRRPPDGDR